MIIIIRPEKMKRIQQLLKEVNGAQAELARYIKITPASVYTTLSNKNCTLRTKKRYTFAFNDVFDTSYTYEELFEEI